MGQSEEMLEGEASETPDVDGLSERFTTKEGGGERAVVEEGSRKIR